MFDDTLTSLPTNLSSRLASSGRAFADSVVPRTEATSIRHQRLPAEQLVWLMVASTLYCHKSISEVLNDTAR
jgi:hypothetical protein